MSKTRKTLQYLFLAIIVVGLGYFASMHLSEQKIPTVDDILLSSALQDKGNSPELKILKQGAFNPDALDSDGLHRGSGGVALVDYKGENKLVLMDDFTVTNGPDYKIYLLEHSDVQTEKRFKQIKDMSYQLDSLKQFKGYQVFTLPEDMDPEQIQSVLIWCEAFSQFISNADLQ
ncbi:MAG: DM13 domain-containing protein [Candidatus Porifericomitaceae bacterium WSBS_2022_MAG_OTU9]